MCNYEAGLRNQELNPTPKFTTITYLTHAPFLALNGLSVLN